MKLTFSNKAEMFGEGIFSKLNDRKKELEKEGKTIYNLSVGTPDFETPEHIRKAVAEASLKAENYRYSLADLPELTEAVQKFYQSRFGVLLEKNEIMSMNGSQEGMAHFAWSLCNPGDVVLVPNPGYPIFRIGPELCDAVTIEYPLYEENHFIPKLEEIPEETARKARFMVVCYPSNPVCSAADDKFYEELIAFAKKYEVIILHDNAYADIVFDGKKGKSFLQYEGAKEVGVEFYSLSKSYNYTGARVSFCVGNPQIVEKFKAVRTQIDYGIFYPVQYGAIAALTGPQDSVIEQCKTYEKRSRTLSRGLTEIGWKVKDTQGTMFVWAPLPDGYTSSEKFCMELMEKSGVICTPGNSFGSLGEGYVRFALVLPEEKLLEAIESIRMSGILK